MAQLYVVRHGQASFGQQNYDQLSPLGYQQARWLGTYFKKRNIQFDRVISGDLSRQIQTADSIIACGDHPAVRETHIGFNEYPLAALRAHYATEFPVLASLQEPRDLIYQLPILLKAWMADSDGDLPETWLAFNQRIREALAFAQQSAGANILVVSSAGTIATALHQIMKFDMDALIGLNLTTMNTAVTQCYFDAKAIHATNINWTPHLDIPSRMEARSYI